VIQEQHKQTGVKAKSALEKDSQE